MTTAQYMVSVIIPTFNHGLFIAYAIKSVLRQSYNNIEVIVVDNYSTDNTFEIVSSIKDARVKYYKFENNGVIAASRNFGVKNSSGAILAFLDSDDFWEKEKLSVQIPLLMEAPDIACVSSNYYIIGNDTLWRNRLKFKPGEVFADYSYNDLILENVIVNSSAVIKKKVYEEIGGLNEDPEYIAFEDWDLWLRCCRSGNLRVARQPLVGYRIHAGNSKNKLDIHKRTLKLLSKHRELGYLSEILYKDALGRRSLLLGRSCLSAGNKKEGIKHYMFALRKVNSFTNKVRSFYGVFLILLPSRIMDFIVLVVNKMVTAIQGKSI